MNILDHIRIGTYPKDDLHRPLVPTDRGTRIPVICTTASMPWPIVTLYAGEVFRWSVDGLSMDPRDPRMMLSTKLLPPTPVDDAYDLANQIRRDMRGTYDSRSRAVANALVKRTDAARNLCAGFAYDADFKKSRLVASCTVVDSAAMYDLWKSLS